MHRFRRMLLTIAVSFPIAAVAQESEAARKGEELSNSGRGTLETVVVTAQKREERLQDVPISISVLNGNALDRATGQGVTDALSRVPGVATTVNQQGGQTQMTIRGVSAGLAQFNGSSPVGYYIDSVPFGLVKTAIAPDSNAYDLERVEVLRGPQGTLYGASALNGVVRILTRDANLEEFEMKARTTLSGTEDGGENYRGDLAVNVPLITSKLGARAVIGYERLGGWIDRTQLNKSDANDARLRNLRLKVGAQPTSALSVDLLAWFSRSEYDEAPLSRDGKQSLAPIDEPNATDYDVYGLKIGYDFSAFSLTSTTSYLDYQNDSILNIAARPLYTGLSSEVSTEEILVNSADSDRWRWSLGGIYREADDRQLQTLPVFLDAPIDFTDRSKSFAVYGELTRLLLDQRLELTAGLRHFEDDVTQRENSPRTGDPAQPLYHRQKSFKADSPRFVATWHQTDDLTLYASYAKGFRSGFNQDAEVAAVAPALPAVEADTLKNYELGIKADLLDNRVSFDGAIYYMDWRNVQQSLAVPFFTSFVTAPINGDSASGTGIDMSIAARPVTRLELALSFSWNDLSMDTDVFSEGVVLFAKGDRLSYSPEYTAGASGDYLFLVGRGGYKARFSASVNYTSERAYRTVLGGEQTIWSGDELLLADASVSLESPTNWTATLFADNLNNEDGVPILNIFNNPDRTVRTRPRTVGVQFEFRF